MLTILTEPSLSLGFNITRSIKRTIKRVLGLKINEYSGHYGVVRSVLKGLKDLRVEHNYNPRRLKDLGDHVHVLADVKALKSAIGLKQRGQIKRLTAGPNIVISAAEHSDIIGAPEIDLYTVNSEWTKEAYVLDNPKLQGKIEHWYAGVDESEWMVSRKSGSEALHLLFYLKRPEWKLVEECKDELRKRGVRFSELIYGNYSFSEFKEMLDKVDAVVYFVEQESQGIALFEIWATDIPTLVWNPGYWQYKMKNYRSSSAPYLSEETGLFFRDVLEFQKCLDVLRSIPKFTPRHWVMENATDKIATDRFLKVIGYHQ